MTAPIRLLRPAASLALSACLGLAVVAAACGDDSPTGGSPAAGGNPAEGGAGAGTTNGGAPSNGGGGADGGNGGAPSGGGGADCGLPPLMEAPELLSETGLYSDFANETVADDVFPYEPRYPLWSDGATKNRWAYLPPVACAGPIDTSDMDFWQVPVGARFWKEFTRDGVRVETRLISRFGPGENDYEYASYYWDGSGDAVNVGADGLAPANTDHVIPSRPECKSCHDNPARVLGFAAIQLTGNPGAVNMQTLSDGGMLSDPLPGGVTIPGNDLERDALGCLHGNCGGCHFEGGAPNTAMRLKVLSTQTTVETTSTFLTAVNKTPTNYQCAGGVPCDLIEPMNTDLSAVWERIDLSTMPPYAVTLSNTDCRDKVGLWINQLPLTSNL